MLKEAYDAAAGSYVASLAKGTEADYALLVRSVTRLLTDGRARADGVVVVLFIEDGDGPPNALWRKRLAEARAIEPELARYCVYVTSTPLIRWMLTAVQWVTPNRTQTDAVVKSSWDDALGWLRLRLSPGRMDAVMRLQQKVESSVQMVRA